MRRLSAQDIYPQLTRRFLQGLAEQPPARAGKACRGVLFLDAFEALRRGLSGDAQGRTREAWLRRAYTTDAPLLLVFCHAWIDGFVGRALVRPTHQSKRDALPQCEPHPVFLGLHRRRGYASPLLLWKG
jgi:hypothetical protein